MKRTKEDNAAKSKRRPEAEPLHTDFPLSEKDELGVAEQQTAINYQRHNIPDNEKLKDDEDKPVKDAAKKK